MINETLARTEFWQRGSDRPPRLLRRRSRHRACPSGTRSSASSATSGIASVEGEPDARAYDLFGQHWGRTISLAVRSRRSPAPGRVDGARAAGAARSARLRSSPFASTGEIVSTPSRRGDCCSGSSRAFALAGFGVATLGVYGIVACLVAERQREIGVRVALGATAANIHQLVLGSRTEAGRCRARLRHGRRDCCSGAASSRNCSTFRRRTCRRCRRVAIALVIAALCPA